MCLFTGGMFISFENEKLARKHRRVLWQNFEPDLATAFRGGAVSGACWWLFLNFFMRAAAVTKKKKNDGGGMNDDWRRDNDADACCCVPVTA